MLKDELMKLAVIEDPLEHRWNRLVSELKIIAKRGNHQHSVAYLPTGFEEKLIKEGLKVQRSGHNVDISWHG